MGKIFITDEINDTYTATVTSGKLLRVENGASNFYRVSSAHTLISAVSASSGACFVKSVIVGTIPATASSICLYDTSVCASHVSAFGTSGGNIIAVIGLDVSGSISGSPTMYPKIFPINVYCTTGLSVGIGTSATDKTSRVGCIKDITVIYQA